MKKILAFSMLILALNLSGAEGESEYPQSGSSERKPEVKSGYNAVSTRGVKAASSATNTRVTQTATRQTSSRAFVRVNLRKPTRAAGSVGGTTNAASSL